MLTLPSFARYSSKGSNGANEPRQEEENKQEHVADVAPKKEEGQEETNEKEEEKSCEQEDEEDSQQKEAKTHTVSVGQEKDHEDNIPDEQKQEEKQESLDDDTKAEQEDKNEQVEEEPKAQKDKQDEKKEALSLLTLPSLIKGFKSHKSRNTKGKECNTSPVDPVVDEAISWAEQALVDETTKEGTSQTVGADLLDELENDYRMGLSQRINERSCGEEKKEADEASETEQAQENESVAENPCSPVSVLDAPLSPRSTPSQTTRWYLRKPKIGEHLTHEQALEMTVDKLRRQLEDMEEERDTLVSTVHTLQGKVEAQAAKIEALEYFFRKVNHREEEGLNRQQRGWEDTSFASLSSGDSPLGMEQGVGENLFDAEGPLDDEQDDDEAWELEDAPPKLSLSFQRTGQKMRSAKTRAAAKLASITIV